MINQRFNTNINREEKVIISDYLKIKYNYQKYDFFIAFNFCY